MSNHKPVIIAGAGITGLSAALHLASSGCEEIIIVAPPDECESKIAPGLIFGGHRDNFTRLVVAHQQDFAMELWRFGDRAYDALIGWAKKRGIPVTSKQRLRLIASKEELAEARLAVDGLTASGFHPLLLVRNEENSPIPWAECGPEIIAIQSDGPKGAWIDCDRLFLTLCDSISKQPAVRFVEGKITRVRGYGMADLVVETTAKDLGKLPAAAVIVASHLQSGQIIPELKSALVSVADQWIQCHQNDNNTGGNPAWNPPGTVWTVNHGHDWGVISDSARMILGGGRILREFAGFEATQATVEKKITRFIVEKHEQRLPRLAIKNESIRALAGLDCFPCDELPIVGPMFGEGRILIATGFYGMGIHAAFYAGFCLAKLLMTGECSELPRRLWPERLRSLPSQD